jgi:PKD repeat protein
MEDLSTVTLRSLVIGIVALSVSLLLLTGVAHAQRENNIWYFGDRAGIDFNAHPPRPLLNGAMTAAEGSAIACDRSTGQLLFYTNGDTVWNRRHSRMPNGTGLAGGESSTQAALTLRQPGSETRYYIFTTANSTDPVPNDGLTYSVVDLTADGGFGDVVTRNVQLVGGTAEKVTAVPHCNGSDYWVITHDLQSNAFYVFLLSSAGVASVPVVSNVGTPHGDQGIGYLVGSPDGGRLALVARSAAAELFDFDRCSGVVSGALTLPAAINGYGVAFSPGNSKLYIGENRDLAEHVVINQYDLSSNDSAAVVASGIRIADISVRGWGVSAMRLAPDGKIYVARCCQKSTLGVIENPDARGAACGYLDSAFSLAGRVVEFGLPNFVDSYPRLPFAGFALSDTIICQGSCIALIDASTNGPERWRWLLPGGSPPQVEGEHPSAVCYDSAGRFPVSLVVSNGAGADTLTRYVTVRESPRVNAGFDVVYCRDGGATIGGEATGGLPPYRYDWTPATGLNSTTIATPVAAPGSATRYTLTVTDANGCQGSSAITVRPGARLDVASSLVDGVFRIDSTDMYGLRCTTLRLGNSGLVPVVLEGPYLDRNTAFSFPPGQFPMTIMPGEERGVQLCFQPDAPIEARDTLTLPIDCFLQIPLVSYGRPLISTGSDRCGTGLVVGSADSGHALLRLTPPYPNPAANDIRVAAETIAGIADGASAVCLLRDMRGNLVATGRYLERSAEAIGRMVHRQGAFRVDVADLPSGLYLLAVETPAGTRAFPVVVDH